MSSNSLSYKTSQSDFLNELPSITLLMKCFTTNVSCCLTKDLVISVVTLWPWKALNGLLL